MESKEYIEKYGKTDDTLLGIIMFWCVTSVDVKNNDIDYFNSKMERYLSIYSTEEELRRYKKVSNKSIMDDDLSIDTLRGAIDTIGEIYGHLPIHYQLHMYGASTDGSGDYWLKNKDVIMSQFGEGVFSIIGSSNGVSLTLLNKLDFLNREVFADLNRHYNLNKLLR